MLRFGEGITLSDLRFHVEGNDLLIGRAEQGVDFADLIDQMRIRD